MAGETITAEPRRATPANPPTHLRARRLMDAFERLMAETVGHGMRRAVVATAFRWWGACSYRSGETPDGGIALVMAG